MREGPHWPPSSRPDGLAFLLAVLYDLTLTPVFRLGAPNPFGIVMACTRRFNKRINGVAAVQCQELCDGKQSYNWSVGSVVVLVRRHQQR